MFHTLEEIEYEIGYNDFTEILLCWTSMSNQQQVISEKLN